MSQISERTKYLAKIFADAIKVSPNDAVSTARELTKLCGDRETFEEIMSGMTNGESELATVLTKMGRAFHKGSDSAPSEIEASDLVGMAKQIRMHSRF